MDREEVIARFGIDPDVTGNRPREWWIVDKPDHEEIMHNVEPGFLCVVARDGGGNPISIAAIKSGDCVATFEDDGDRTYRRYYYRPIYYYYRPIRDALEEKE